jgi:hypothetical protein
MSRPRKHAALFALAVMLDVVLFGATSPQQPIGDYLSVSTAMVGNSDFARSQYTPFTSDTTTASVVGNLPFPDFSYFNFDRKQNTRLWPFIFTGITRSPPPIG